MPETVCEGCQKLLCRSKEYDNLLNKKILFKVLPIVKEERNCAVEKEGWED